MIFIWVMEQKLGENCLKKQTGRAYELATAPRLDKPVRFYVQTEPGESCGPPPVANVGINSLLNLLRSSESASALSSKAFKGRKSFCH